MKLFRAINWVRLIGSFILSVGLVGCYWDFLADPSQVWLPGQVASVLCVAVGGGLVVYDLWRSND